MPDPMKLFTIAEANALIPKLESLFTQINLRYVKVQEILGPAEKSASPQELERHLQDHPEVRGMLDEIQRFVAAIQEIGCQFKGIELGLVDFPFVHNDQIALLCWQYGEKEIRWWHSQDSGFSSRRPLPGATTKIHLN